MGEAAQPLNREDAQVGVGMVEQRQQRRGGDLRRHLLQAFQRRVAQCRILAVEEGDQRRRRLRRCDAGERGQDGLAHAGIPLRLKPVGERRLRARQRRMAQRMGGIATDGGVGILERGQRVRPGACRGRRRFRSGLLLHQSHGVTPQSIPARRPAGISQRVSWPAIRPDGSTTPAPPRRIRSCGMPKTTALSSDSAMVRPPRA